ncbi:hypothetical protein [Flavobacterium sp. B183]|uniref:hypothetical protein n=1 Tax=Flavobacterium sp. B183 TaxID=907046 RepID=UPI00201EB1F9|nr:hypothetical protein [Flavobacterium sp. B183]URC13931.1 hypothetical protein M4I44_05915 [Flavobacterium sp. B183]URC14048.1 hypothetical protein M4I44_06570 [Flavobacterium sp. B183]
MKKLVFIIMILSILGCKTKTVTVEKTIEKEKESVSKYLDSLFQQSLNINLNYQKHQLTLNDNLKLSSIAELDSSGIRKPFHYKHYVNGKLKEEIYLEGGEINKNTNSSNLNELEKKEAVRTEKTLVESDVGEQKATEKDKVHRNKNAKTNGFQFGFYVWVFLLILLLIIISWVSKRFNLPNSIKKCWVQRRNKKSPPN